MTRQDVSLGHIGPIRIGGGFSGKTPARKHEFPIDILTEFLNFKPKNEETIFEFCSNYQIIYPSFAPQIIVKSFLKDQKRLKEIATRLYKNTFTQKDLDLINKQLAKIKLEVKRPITDKDINTNNVPSELTSKFNTKDILLQKKYPNSVTPLWEELVRRFIEKQDIKTCANCGDFFRLTSNHKRRYCDKPECKNTYNKRKSRLKNK